MNGGTLHRIRRLEYRKSEQNKRGQGCRRFGSGRRQFVCQSVVFWQKAKKSTKGFTCLSFSIGFLELRCRSQKQNASQSQSTKETGCAPRQATYKSPHYACADGRSKSARRVTTGVPRGIDEYLESRSLFCDGCEV